MVNKKQDGNYSFRQRRNTTSSNFQSFKCNNNDNSTKINKNLRKDNTTNKTKSKAAPLSKYRRKTANARERTRMREINLAFENLRKCVPQSYNNSQSYNSLSSSSSSSTEDQQSASTNEKLTKITTLRLAMMYIRTLSDALENNECHTIDFIDKQNTATLLNTKLNNCDNIKNDKLYNKKNTTNNNKMHCKSLKKSILSDNKITTKIPTATTTKTQKITKRPKYRRIHEFEEHNYSDFASYTLESDGESLSFSEETDNSSIQSNNQHNINNSTNNSKNDHSSSCHSSSSSLIDEPLELILPDFNDNLNDMDEDDFSTPFLTSTDLDCMIHPFTDLFSDLVAEPTLDYLI